MPLTETRLRALKTKDKSYKVADQRGLYIEVTPAGGKLWRFVDTAGIRRRVHLQQGADFYASLRTTTALEKAEVAVVMIDVTQVISEQDVRIIDLVLESGRALVLARPHDFTGV